MLFRSGHRRLPNENLSYDMTEAEAEALLRKDLAVRYKLFRKFGKDALLLTVLSFNVGQGVLPLIRPNIKSPV